MVPEPLETDPMAVRLMPHLNLCQLTVTDGRECQQPVPEDFPMKLCETHALMTAAVMMERGGATMRRLRSMYDTTYVRRLDRAEETPRPPQYEEGAPQVVYYLRFGGKIKIGTSRNLLMRLKQIPHDELLAIEPGGRTQEKLRHSQFAENRLQGEWFEADADMEDHVAHIVEMYGQPFDAHAGWSNKHAA